MIALRARITESASNAFAVRVADSRKDMHVISCICQCAVLALSILGGHLMGEDSILYITVTIIITIIAHALALLYGITSHVCNSTFHMLTPSITQAFSSPK
jgi:hypothetical protein